jgi:hypothetical protein
MDWLVIAKQLFGNTPLLARVLSAPGAALAEARLWYGRVPVGEFASYPILQWTGPQFFRVVGGGSFRTADGQLIDPCGCRTNGGSIPHVLRGLPGLDPHDYTPAYVLHDYAFSRRHDKPFVDFLGAGNLLASAIKTLVQSGIRDSSGHVTPLPSPLDRPELIWMIYEAVTSWHARLLWDSRE